MLRIVPREGGNENGINAKGAASRLPLYAFKTKSGADQAALTPLSLKSVSSSPDWNISRTMSQPPMNSPFT